MKFNRRLEVLSIAAIVLVATILRLAALDRIPPGLTHDEAGHGHDAIAILNSARPIYLTVGYGREPLYDYTNALAMSILGPHAITLRFTSAFTGILLLPLVYLFARRAFSVRVAVITIAFLAVSFWPVAISRQALRSSLLPTLLMGAIFIYYSLYSHTPIHPHSLRYRISLTILFGLLISATLYTYIPARILWLIFIAFLIYLAFFHRVDFKRMALPTLIGLACAGLLVWPMFAYLQANPGAEARLSMLDAPLQALQRGDLSVILSEATSAIAAWFVPGRGDDFLAYTIRGRPIFDPITFVLFAAGLFLSVRNFHKPQYALLLIWLIIGVAPSLITGNDASMTRSIGALPVFYILPAIGVVWLADRIRNARVVYAAFGLLLALTSIFTINDYFNVWGQSPDVRAAYQSTTIEMATTLGDQPNDIAVSSVYPLAPHDPYVAQVTLSLDHMPFRWFDARSSLIFPSDATTLAIPASTPPNPYWQDLLGQPVERIDLRPDDLDPYFDLYTWDAQASAQRALQRANPRMDNFGDAVLLTGIDVLTPQIEASGTIEVVSFWCVLDASKLGPQVGAAHVSDLVLFTHALDANGAVLGQQDQLDAPSWSWHSGDLVAQIHRFTLHTPPASDMLSLEVGIYDRTSGVRLPLIVDSNVSGDNVIAATVEVRR